MKALLSTTHQRQIFMMREVSGVGFFERTTFSCMDFLKNDAQILIGGKRNVWVNDQNTGGPKSSEGPKGPEEITLDNLGKAILELNDKKAIRDEDKDAAWEILDSDNQENKNKLLRLTKDLAEAVKKGKSGQQKAKFQWEVSKMRSGNGDDAEKTAEKTSQKEDQESKKNKPIEELQSKTHADVANMFAQIREMEQYIKGQVNETQNENSDIQAAQDKMEQLVEKMSDLEKRQEEARAPLQKMLGELVKSRKIDETTAQALFDLDPRSKNFKKEWYELTHNLTHPGMREKLEKLKEAKQNEAVELNKIKEEATKIRLEMGEIVSTLHEKVKSVIDEQKATERFQRRAGLPLNPGSKLVYFDVGERYPSGVPGGNSGEKKELFWKKMYIEVKKISFRKNIGAGPDGTIREVSTSTPYITFEILDEKTGEKTEKTLSQDKFIEFVEKDGVVENLKEFSDLEGTLKQEVKAGDIFEYRTYKDATKEGYDAQDEQVQIVDLIDGENETGEKIKLIKLNKPVVVSPSMHAKSDTLTPGEFARWVKREEAMKPLKLEGLRQALIDHNKELNAEFGRNSNEYPPIQATINEIIRYAGDPTKTFVIKEITENEIILDDQPASKFTFASFLRWVKKNEVEKVDAKADAARALKGIEDPEQRAIEEAKMQKQKEQDMEYRRGHPSGSHDDAYDPEGHKPHATHNHGHGHDEPQEYSLGLYDRTMKFLFKDTKWLDFTDLEMLIWTKNADLIKRKHHTAQESAVGKIGKNMYGWIPKIGGTLLGEYKGIEQHAENQEVSHHAEHMRTMGEDFPLEELHETNDPFVMKAAMTVLAEKGLLRWDDPTMHKTLNRIADGHPEWVRTGSNTYMTSIERILDNMFGPGTFREFYIKQDNGYKGVMSSFEEAASKLEADPENNGGLLGALQNMLMRHLHGDPINPAQYESFIRFAISAGKLNFEQKMFFFMAGLSLESKPHTPHGHGKTLFPIDRIGAIEGNLLRAFPILDFYTKGGFPQFDDKGEPIYERNDDGVTYKLDENGNRIQKTGKIRMRDLQEIVHNHILKDFENQDIHDIKDFTKMKPGKHLLNFIDKVMIWDPAVSIRISKSSSDPIWDHEDAQKFITAGLGEETITNVLAKQGGAKPPVSIEGIKNTYAGYSDYIALKLEMMKDHLAEAKKNPAAKIEAKRDLRHLVNMLRTFVRFDAIVDNRYDHGKNMTRFGPQEYNSTPPLDSDKTVGKYQSQLHAFIGKAAEELKLGNEWNIITTPTNEDTQGKKDLQNRVVSGFGNKFESGLLALGDEEKILAFFEKIQEENSHHDLMVERMGERRKARSGVQEEKEQALELQPYINTQLVNKAQEYRELQRQIREAASTSPEKIKAARAAQLETILKKIENREFDGLDEKEAEATIEQGIQSLRQRLQSGGPGRNRQAA